MTLELVYFIFWKTDMAITKSQIIEVKSDSEFSIRFLKFPQNKNNGNESEKWKNV